MSERGGTLRGRVVGGLAWNIASQVVGSGTRVIVGIVLARLLTPHEFGIAGMAIVFSNLMILFTDLSFGAALIQRPEITEMDRSTIFWVTVGVGVVCTAVGIGISGLIGAFYHQPQVASLFAVLSIGFVLNALSATQSALLARDLAYRSLQIRDMIAAVLGGAVAIIAAVAGLGAWAIVSQSLATAAAAAILIWTLSPWRPQLIFSLRSLRELGGFGAKLFASRLLNYLNLNADNLLVGRFLGGGALGNYSLAYNVMFTPMVRLGLPFQQVVFPAYSQMQTEPARLGQAWLKSKRLSAAVLAPGFLAIFVVAPDLVPVVFGAKWHTAIPVLRWLCVAGVAHSFVTLNWSVLQAQGKAGVLFGLNCLSTVVTLGAFILGLHWGIVGVAACYAVARWVLIIPDTWITVGTLPLRTVGALRVSGAAVPLACGAAAIAMVFRTALVSDQVPAAVRLGLVLIMGLWAYVGLTLFAAPGLVGEIMDLRGVIRARAASRVTEEPI
jgi:O-antigen/teichoic acid export membrane protein